MTNLLTNAIHYNRAGSRVWITTRRKVALKVPDSGPGIAGEGLPLVFKRFYRAHKARSRTSGDSGLGLAISKAIVEAHDGEITVSSEAGVGRDVHRPAARANPAWASRLAVALE